MDNFKLFLLLITMGFTCQGDTTPLQQTYACFNTVLNIRCDADQIIVFDTARYGRNDTRIAPLCHTLFTSKCDVDAHFTLNRLCSGKQDCALLVNTELFGDPCGYDEFLKVTYQCIYRKEVASQCQSLEGAEPHLDHGYVASPNYPSKYYMDAECVWQLQVQPRQTINIILLDFELDVKRGGFCYDFLEIRTDDHTYFKDCGALGKQSIAISSNRALVRFHTAQSGLTQRGFVIYFEGIGPGCEDLTVPTNGTVTYQMIEGELQATVTCNLGHVILGSPDQRSKVVHCYGSAWNDTLTSDECLLIVPTTPYMPTMAMTTSSTIPLPKDSSQLDESSSIVGMALGVVSAILLITLLLVLALYLHRRRKKAERKLDEMRVVFNNLQPEPTINDGSIYKLHTESPYACSPGASSSNLRKARRDKKSNKNWPPLEDELQGRNLLATPPLQDDEEDYCSHHKTPDTNPKYYDECRYVVRKHPPPAVLVPPQRRTVRSSKDSLLNCLAYDPYTWEEDLTEYKITAPPPVPPRRMRHNRSCSGAWEKQATLPLQMGPQLSPTKRLITMSAPDLLQDLTLIPDIPSPSQNTPLPWDTMRCQHGHLYSRGQSREQLSRSTTLGCPHSHRTVKKQRSRSSSRVNVRT